MSLSQRAAYQCECAALEAMQSGVDYTVIGMMAQQWIAYVAGQWRAV